MNSIGLEKQIFKSFRFMVGPGHCPMISKYGSSLSKAVDPSFLVVKKSHINTNIHLTASLQTLQIGSQYSKTCIISSHSKKTKNKDLDNKW